MTDTTPVPPVPSREAVEKWAEFLESREHVTSLSHPAKMLRTLLAEVERLTGVEGDAIVGAIAWAYERDALKRTVAEQGAALAELERDAKRYRYLRQPNNCILYARVPQDGWGSDNHAHVKYLTPEEYDQNIDAALASAQSQ